MIRQVHPILSDPIEAAIPQLKCEPAMYNGSPVKMWINIPFHFCTLN